MDFNSQLARMKSLYNYNIVAESKTEAYVPEHTIAADGKSYAIIRENTKYFIKVAPKEKQNIAEAYDYIGGWNNHKDYEYDSYNTATKHFEAKLRSLNEAYNANVLTEGVDRFMKDDIVVESTDAVRREIARQRQIMYNAAAILNESAEIDPKFTVNPADPGKEKGVASADNAADQSTPYDENGKAELDKDMQKTVNDPKKANKGFMTAKCDLKEADEKTFNAGLPSSAGVGEAKPEEPYDEKAVNEEVGEDWETGLNKGPNDAENANGQEPYGEGPQPVNEGDDFDLNNLPPAPEEDGKEGVLESEEEDDVIDLGDEEDGVEDVDLGDEEGDVEDIDLGDDMDDLDDFDDEDGDVEDVDLDGEEGDAECGDELAELQAKVAELEAKIAELEGGEDADFEDEGDVEDVDLGGEDDFITDADLEGDAEDADFEGEGEFEDDVEDDVDIDECGNMPMLESVVKGVISDFINGKLNEDKLAVWGKHPGYRKKPFTTPETGQDKNEHGEDWNDESVHSEEPFGSKIGDSAPYEALVKTITDSVMTQLGGKKKE